MGILEKEEEHLVKKVCKELGLTYKELGEQIGYGEGNLKNSVFKNQVSKQLQKAIELYLENLKLKQKIERTNQLQVLLKTFIEDKDN